MKYSNGGCFRLRRTWHPLGAFYWAIGEKSCNTSFECYYALRCCSPNASHQGLEIQFSWFLMADREHTFLDCLVWCQQNGNKFIQFGTASFYLISTKYNHFFLLLISKFIRFGIMSSYWKVASDVIYPHRINVECYVCYVMSTSARRASGRRIVNPNIESIGEMCS